jgi:hypothetical protein
MKTNEESQERRLLTRRDVLRGMAALGGAAALSRIGLGATLPGGAGNAPKPVRFSLLGDWGSGDASTVEIARQMAAVHDRAPLDMVVTAGDNIYPDGAASRFAEYFERPFVALIKRNVPFYATLGNHDVRAGAEAQMRYPLFHMGGRNYYTVAAGGSTLELFMLDSNAMDGRQVRWLEGSLERSSALWKVAVFHHPPFSSGKKHGSDERIRRALHPIFVRAGVAAVFSGHDHVYQRVTPQEGVQYFVSGAGGKIRVGNLKMADPLVAAGYDDDSHFMLIEADAAGLNFSAINTGGKVVDEGRLVASALAPPATAAAAAAGRPRA